MKMYKITVLELEEDSSSEPIGALEIYSQTVINIDLPAIMAVVNRKKRTRRKKDEPKNQ